MRLSIAMIVKNEEKYIEGTLKPLKQLQNYLDSEIVIVDTGSTDRTVEIAKKYTDEIYFHKWNNDFGSMRNISIEHCTGDWIMVVDADEVLYDVKKLAEIVNNKNIDNSDFISIDIINFTKNIDYSLKNGALTPMIRIFKRNSIKYKGRIHEQPTIDAKKAAFYSGVRFVHYGYYGNDYNLMEYKYKRNLSMLLRDLKDNPEDPYILFQISATYDMHNCKAEALKYIESAYKAAKDSTNRVPFYILQKYCILLYKNSEYSELYNIALEGKKQLEDNMDFHFFLGTAFYFKNDYKSASKAYVKYLNLNNSNKSVMGGKNINTYSVMTRGFKDNAIYNLSICYSRLKLNAKALNILDKIENKNIIKDNLNIVLDIAYKSGELERLIDLGKYIDKYNYESVLCFCERHFTLDDLNKIYKNLIQGKLKDIIYIIRYFKESGNIDKSIKDKIEYIISKDGTLYSIYVYYLLKYNIDEINFLKNYGKDKLENVLVKIAREHFDFNEVLDDYIKDTENINLNKIWTRVIILKALLLSERLSEDRRKNLFLDYVSCRYYCIVKCYSREIIEENSWIMPEEDRIILNIKKVLEYKYTDPLEYIRALKKLISNDNLYIKYIKVLAEDVEKPVSDKIKGLVSKYIKDVEKLITDKKYQEAYDSIEYALKLIKFDYDLMESKLSLLVEFNYTKEAFKCLGDIILYAPLGKVTKLLLENF